MASFDVGSGNLADNLIGNLLNAGGMIGASFAQGQQRAADQQDHEQARQLNAAKLTAIRVAAREA